MSAWYDTSLEEEGERRTLDEMSVDCDYGVINYGQKLPSFVVDGEDLDGEYSNSDMDVDSQEDTEDGYWNPYRKCFPRFFEVQR
jgi:hypothetical protein